MTQSAVCRSVCQTSMLLAVVLYKVTWKVLGLGANKISAPGLTGELIGEIVKIDDNYKTQPWMYRRLFDRVMLLEQVCTWVGYEEIYSDLIYSNQEKESMLVCCSCN